MGGDSPAPPLQKHTDMKISSEKENGLMAIAACAIWPFGLRCWAEYAEWPWLLHFDVLVPSAAELALWRRSFVPLFTGGVHLFTLGMCYLMLGHAVFSRRDA